MALFPHYPPLLKSTSHFLTSKAFFFKENGRKIGGTFKEGRVKERNAQVCAQKNISGFPLQKENRGGFPFEKGHQYRDPQLRCIQVGPQFQHGHHWAPTTPFNKKLGVSCKKVDSLQQK